MRERDFEIKFKTAAVSARQLHNVIIIDELSALAVGYWKMLASPMRPKHAKKAAKQKRLN